MKLISPKFTQPPQPFVQDAENFAFEEERTEGRMLTKQRLAGRRFTNGSFYECIFSSCDLSETVWRGCDFADTVFESCNLSGADMTKSAFRRVRFLSCKGVGTDFSESSLKDVLLEKDLLTYANFSGNANFPPRTLRYAY